MLLSAKCMKHTAPGLNLDSFVFILLTLKKKILTPLSESRKINFSIFEI